MPDPDVSTTVVGGLGAIILTLLGKLGWDHRRKVNENHLLDDLNSDSKPTRRDTILMIMTDRVHAVRNELNPLIGQLQLEDAKMDLRISQNRDDINKLRVDLEAGFRTLSIQMENNSRRIEEAIEKSLDRVWQKLDKHE